MARPPRIPDFSYIGLQRYFLTFSTHDRACHFRSTETVSLVLDQILYTGAEQEIAVLAYCFMPDHLHLLTDTVSERADLLQFAKLVKQRSGWRFRRRHHQPLWQHGYYDHVLRQDEDTLAVACYIINNPLRKGLVEDLLQYPFWGSTQYSREQLLDYVGARLGNASRA